MDLHGLLVPFCFLGAYMLLEAADWGLSLAAPFVSRNEEENKAILGLWKPGLDGNELWLFLGLMILGTGIAGWESSLPSMLLMGFAGVGALLRLAACFARKVFGASLVMKGMSVFSFVAVFVMGLAFTASLNEGGALFSGVGLVCALWLILAAFQMGSLYGAVKVVNPLGERFRAAFLVSGILGFVLFLVMAGMLYVYAGDLYQYGMLLWGSLGGAVVCFLVAFVLTRMRHVAIGLIAGYLSLLSTLVFVFTSVASVLYVHQEIKALEAAPVAMLGAAAVWSLAALGWRLFRNKEKYVWDDHA